MTMKYLKTIFLATLCLVVASSCKKEHYPEYQNGANAQFRRTAVADGQTTTAGIASYWKWTFSKAAPATQDEFIMKVFGSENVASVNVLVDYKKTGSSTTLTSTYKSLTTWPLTAKVSLNDLIALFAAQGVTATNVTVNDQFIFRCEVVLKDGTVIKEQAAVLSALPYMITLTYTVTA